MTARYRHAPAAVATTAGLVLALTGCSQDAAPQDVPTTSTPAGSSPASGTTTPSASSAQACAQFAIALLSGAPTREPESAPAVRAASYATPAYGRLLRTTPPAGQTWQRWREQGVTSVQASTGPYAGGEAPPAGSPYVAYTITRRPQRPGKPIPTQRWDVICTTTRQTGGWLVSKLDLQPALSPPAAGIGE